MGLDWRCSGLVGGIRGSSRIFGGFGRMVGGVGRVGDGIVEIEVLWSRSQR